MHPWMCLAGVDIPARTPGGLNGALHSSRTHLAHSRGRTPRLANRPATNARCARRPWPSGCPRPAARSVHPGR